MILVLLVTACPFAQLGRNVLPLATARMASSPIIRSRSGINFARAAASAASWSILSPTVATETFENAC